MGPVFALAPRYMRASSALMLQDRFPEARKELKAAPTRMLVSGAFWNKHFDAIK